MLLVLLLLQLLLVESHAPSPEQRLQRELARGVRERGGSSVEGVGRLVGRLLAEGGEGGDSTPGRPTAMLRGDAHLQEKQDAREQRQGEAAEWFKRSGGDMRTLMVFQAAFMHHLTKQREADPELSATGAFKLLDTDKDGQLSQEDGGPAVELLQTAGHTTPITYEHFKRLPAIAADSRKRKELAARNPALMKKGPGKQGGHRGWEDLLKTKHGNDPEKLSFLGSLVSGDGENKKKKIGNEDMHRGDAPLTSHEVTKIRDRLNMWVGKAEQKHSEGAPDTGELGVLQDAVESLNHPGLDRGGLKTLMEGLRCACQSFKLHLVVSTS